MTSHSKARRSSPPSAPPEKATIALVARSAGVAVSTVSRFLNGGYVSKAARLKVKTAVDALGFVPSATARNLSTGRRGSIGLVVESSQGLWFMQLLAGIEEELARSQGSLMLASLALHGTYDDTIVRSWIREHRVDGILLAGLTKKERALLNAAATAGLPLALVAPGDATLPGHVVRCENRTAGRLIANHLVDLGHRSVFFGGGPRDSIDTVERYEGLRDGLAAHGIDLPARHVHWCGSWGTDAGVAMGEIFLAKKPSVTAVVLGNDALALGFMRRVFQGGMRVPKDLSVVGFDDVPESGLAWPGLTTAAQPTREMGRAACRWLMETVKAKVTAPSPVRVEYPMRLVIRESTGPVPGSRPRR
jgi:LacI family transcriptional regulator